MNERELKFRVYTHIDKAFIYFDIEDYPSGIAMGVSAPQQFTGIKDHKNVECYEGDIVRYYPLPPFEVSTGIIGEVVFNQGSFAIRVTDRFRGAFKRYNVYFNEDGIEYFEVIGNNCENPELLK